MLIFPYFGKISPNIIDSKLLYGKEVDTTDWIRVTGKSNRDPLLEFSSDI